MALFSNSVNVGYESREKLTAAATAAILSKAGIQPEGAAAAWASDLRGASLQKLAQLVMGGEARSNRALAARLAEAGERPSAVAMASMGSTSSDFPAVLRDSMNQIVLRAYRSAAVTWPLFCNRGSFNNFNPYYAFRVGEGENLQLVREGGEYSDSKVTDGEETLQGFKYGRLFTVTWETLVNDQWGQIIRQPQRFGQAAARLVEDLVYTAFMANPTLGDLGALFRTTAGQKNLETGGGSALSVTSLPTALINMAKQTGLQGNEVLNIVPRFMLVPPELLIAAKILIQSAAATAATYSSGVINPFQDLVAVVPNARLSNATFTGYSTTAWYLVADPAQSDTFQVDFLEGQAEPELLEEDGFETDGRKWKARLCVSVKATEFRSWHKSAGA